MTLVRWQPFREIDSMSSIVRRFLDDNQEAFPSLQRGSFMPRIDVADDEKSVTIHAELAGVDKNNVKITVSDENILTIRGEKKHEETKEGLNFYRVERSFGEFVRTVALPAEVNAEAINATFEQGLLTISIPKRIPAKPKEVEVKIG